MKIRITKRRIIILLVLYVLFSLSFGLTVPDFYSIIAGFYWPFFIILMGIAGVPLSISITIIVAVLAIMIGLTLLIDKVIAKIKKE